MASNEELFSIGVKIVSELIEKEIYLIKKIQKRKKRTVWVKKWISRRQDLGLSSTFLQEVRQEDPTTFRNHLRMSPEKFDELLGIVRSTISKQDTFFRKAIPAEIKLQMTLRYLATGDSFGSLEHAYRVPKSTMSKFLVLVLDSIYQGLIEFIKTPASEEEWKQIAQGFLQKCNFPKCCGALDGKHVRIKCPPFSNSEYYNYKNYFSTVLFALVDSDYKFIYIDVGKNGRINDSTIYRNSTLKKFIEDGSLNFPKWGVIIGDDAFPLSTYLMKPYSHHGTLAYNEKVFNYRLSRGRRIVENAFGILSSRFRIFLRPIDLSPSKVDYVVKASCCLHNWLRATDPSRYFPVGSVDREDTSGVIIPGQWRNEISDASTIKSIKNSKGNNCTNAATTLREKYTNYFMTNGAIEWQWKLVK